MNRAGKKMSNISTFLQTKENQRVKNEPVAMLVKNESEITLVPVKKEAVKDEYFEYDNGDHYYEETVCENTNKIFTLHEEVKQEPGYHISENFEDHQQDPLYINNDEVEKVKEELMFKQDIMEEDAEQKFENTKYSIDIVEHKLQYIDYTNDISSTRVNDVASEWRTFSNEKAVVDPSCAGGPDIPLLTGPDLSTIIGPGQGDASSESFGLSKYQNRRTMSDSDRALKNAFQEISRKANCINLPKAIVDRANDVFKQVHNRKNLKGLSNDAIGSACLYMVCRQERVPRTFKEFCVVSKSGKKEIARCFKLILKALGTSVDLISTADFMPWFCSNLGLPNEIQHAATHIAKKAVEMDIVLGRSPVSIAAAAIYMASQASTDKRSHKEIGNITGVADVTIRQSYKLMMPHAYKLFPLDFNYATTIEQLLQRF